MAGFSLPTSAVPQWAKVVPEDVWKAELIGGLQKHAWKKSCVTIVNFFRRGVISIKILICSPAPSCFSIVTEVATLVLPVGGRRGRVVWVILK